MAMQPGNRGVQANMNVTPLIDILLVLLIIFMVITPLMLLQHSVDIPKKAEVDLPPDITTDQVVLTYTKDDAIFINQNRVERQALTNRIKEIYQNRRDKTIFLNIDPDANYGESVKLIDALHNSGLEKLAVITLKEGEKFQVPGVDTFVPSNPN
jgi:biopolymer transport protein TolR